MWLALTSNHYELNLHQIMPAEQGKTEEEKWRPWKSVPFC